MAPTLSQSTVHSLSQIFLGSGVAPTAPITNSVDNELSFASFGIGGAVVNKGVTE